MIIDDLSITYSAGPTITTQPQSASYVTGDPISALTVAATGTGTLTYQWYSCDDANKTNAAAISGATSASYTPTAAGFYYVTVTDDNGSVDSDVVEITVSAAEAPSFTSVTPSATSVVRGTASTITAVVAGVPTPTIQWYSNTTASNEGGSAIDGATDLTLDLDNTEVGTFYYYAVATNTTSQENNAASAVQTITVLPQTPTLTTGGNFVDSKSVTIAKADGEDAAATISYKIGDGEWTDYTEALNITETSTVYAKVVQGGLESSEVSATYTKIVLDPQTDVTGAATWDWSTVTNSSAVDFSNTDLNNVDVLYSNISKYGYTAVSGLASQSALLMNGQRAYNNANGSKHCQVNYLKFNSTVAGVVVVEYANTGGNAARTVNVNGTKGTEEVTTNTTYKTESFAVDAGAITIKGVQVSDDADKMLRIRKVTFIPNTTINLNASGFATYSTDYDFTVTGAKAYKMALDIDGGTLTGTEVEKVPAGAGVLLKGAINAEVTITATSGASELTGNSLHGTTQADGTTVTKGSNDYYVLSGDTFKKFTGDAFTANKAYFEVDGTTVQGRVFTMIFDDGTTTGVNEELSMKNDDFASAPVYNLAGQRVAQPAKGLYIVNGKKVVIR